MNHPEWLMKSLRIFKVRLPHPQTLESAGGCPNGYGFGFMGSEVTVIVEARRASEANISQEVDSKKCDLCHTPLEVVETRPLVK